jgi:hypothetical protein
VQGRKAGSMDKVSISVRNVIFKLMNSNVGEDENSFISEKRGVEGAAPCVYIAFLNEM